jgi:hypothetical protein
LMFDKRNIFIKYIFSLIEIICNFKANDPET